MSGGGLKPGARILIVRILLGLIFAVLLSRLFLPSTGAFSIAAMALGLVLFAYIFEYVRNMKN